MHCKDVTRKETRLFSVTKPKHTKRLQLSERLNAMRRITMQSRGWVGLSGHANEHFLPSSKP